MNIPKTMQAMVLEGHGGLEQLVFHDNWPTPEPNDHEAPMSIRARAGIPKRSPKPLPAAPMQKSMMKIQPGVGHPLRSLAYRVLMPLVLSLL